MGDCLGIPGAVDLKLIILFILLNGQRESAESVHNNNNYYCYYYYHKIILFFCLCFYLFLVFCFSFFVDLFLIAFLFFFCLVFFISIRALGLVFNFGRVRNSIEFYSLRTSQKLLWWRPVYARKLGENVYQLFFLVVFPFPFLFARFLFFSLLASFFLHFKRCFRL